MKAKRDYKKLLKPILKWGVILVVFFAFFWFKYGLTPTEVPSFLWEKTKAFGQWADTEVGYFVGSTKKLKNNMDNEVYRAQQVYEGKAYLEVPEPEQ